MKRISVRTVFYLKTNKQQTNKKNPNTATSNLLKNGCPKFRKTSTANVT